MQGCTFAAAGRSAATPELASAKVLLGACTAAATWHLGEVAVCQATHSPCRPKWKVLPTPSSLPKAAFAALKMGAIMIYRERQKNVGVRAAAPRTFSPGTSKQAPHPHWSRHITSTHAPVQAHAAGAETGGRAGGQQALACM